MADISNFFVGIGSTFDDKGVKEANKAFGGFVVTLGDVINITTKVVGAMKSVVDAASAQEEAEITLAAAMKQAGTYTDAAFKHNIDYANSLQKVTTYGDEAILGVQRLLTNFGVEGPLLDKLTQATLDLATAKKMDLGAAADIVAKSVGSSTNALARYGVEIKGAAGSTERASMAVDNISKLFGGSALASAQTFSGQMKVLGNRWDEILESIGNNVIPIFLELFDIINANILPVFEDWIKSVNESGAGIQWASKLLQGMISIVIGVKAAFDLAGTAAATFGLALTGHFAAAKLGWEELKTKTTEYGTLLEDTAKISTDATKKSFDRQERIIRSFTGTAQAAMYSEVATHKTATETMLAQQTLWMTQKQFLDTNYMAWQAAQDKLRLEAFVLDMQTRLATTQAFFNSAMSVATAYSNMQTQNIQNELAANLASEQTTYTNRKAWINANVKDETTRQKMLDNLEKTHTATTDNLRKESERKEKEAKNKMKGWSIAEAVINTALSATKSFANFGWPLGAVMAALALAAGAIQISTIKAQKFAKGAMVTTATPALFGEAGPEVALPLTHPATTEALSRALELAGGGGANQIYITVPPITTRGEARRLGEVIGDELIRKIKRNRLV